MPRKKIVLTQAIGEEVRISVDASLRQFLLSEPQKELEFPSSLTAPERAYVHDQAIKLGLKSKSRGKKTNRFVTVYKRDGSTIVQEDAQFQLSRSTRQIIVSFMQKFPVTSKERQDLIPPIERDRTAMPDVREMNKTICRLPSGVPQVPPPPGVVQELIHFKQSLPIYAMKDEILKVIASNPVCIIEGETGSGKSTQVPQYLLEHCRLQSKQCRIIVTEPRRIATIALCDRVAAERDESIGNVVGYQIRLECRMSAKTVLSFCTTGVLLRTLMCGESNLTNVTHIIIDEVHERDKFCDFLLIAIKDLLNKFRNLRVILMSASVDTTALAKYFNNCPVVSVPGRQYPVTEYFLEDVLQITGYTNEKMAKLKLAGRNKKTQKEQLEKWKKTIESQTEGDSSDTLTKTISVPSHKEGIERSVEKSEPGPLLQAQVDQLLAEAFQLPNNEEALYEVISLLLADNVSVDYQHSETKVTALTVAAVRGYINAVEQLLSLGANVWIRDSNGWTAADWAENRGYKDIVELIKSSSDDTSSVTSPLSSSTKPLSQEAEELLTLYHETFNEETVDHDLIMALILEIHCKQPKGAILVFLPGYDDIINIREKILADDKKLTDHMRYNLYTLHSKMQTTDQKKVFKPAPPNTRKIILSTNIAETSITIDDVVYVIDGGKVKEKCYDSVIGISSLRTEWISQACAKQRKGRAGRTQNGYCYHLFSSLRYNTLLPHSTPEIIRVPLQELCLHSKLLAPSNTPIAEFLAKALDPPPFMVTRNAVQLLKTMDALDPWEDLTELGVHLLDLPIEPRLGKMLLYSVVLKCLDPILTIVSCLAYGEPFILPSLPSLKLSSNDCKKRLAAGSFSDHMVLLRAFQNWQQSKCSGWERQFCEKNFISAPAMEMILGTRAQLLGQLRTSGFIRTRAPGDIRDLNSNSENWAVVKAALCAGLYPNLARVDREHSVLRTKKECKVSFHYSSTLRDLPKGKSSLSQALNQVVDNLPTDWVMYEQLSQNGRFCLIHTCTVLSPITVAIFSGPSKLPLENIAEVVTFPRPDALADPDSDSETEEKSEIQQSILKIDDWVLFKADSEAVQLALNLRQKWHAMFSKRMKAPNKSPSPSDEAVVKTIVSVLSAEEQALHLTQPPGIGQRPRPCKEDDNFVVGQVANNENKQGTRKVLGSNLRNEQADEPTMSTGNGPRTKFFAVKAQNMKSIDNAVLKNSWGFAPNVERKIIKAFNECKSVILIFNVQGTGHFQGFARLKGVEHEPNTNQLPIEWVKRANVSFQATKHLLNKLNDNRRVQYCRDGQEIEATVGAALCALWDKPQLYQANQQENAAVGGRPIRGGPVFPDYQVLQRSPHFGK